jgi:integrase
LSWPEVDLDQGLLTIPGIRMKGRITHLVPLAPTAKAILEGLPRWTGDFLFSTTAGTKPIRGFGRVKKRIDKLSGVSGWIIHDLRRTARTHFSALPIEDVVRERVIAHAKSGLHKVYDLHEYEAEKRHCLELWESRSRAIVDPPPDNVADLNEARAERRAATS